MTGKCIEFDTDKGYGTIQGEDFKKYFCHFSAIQSERISLDVDEIVEFTPTDSERGKMATMVKHS